MEVSTNIEVWKDIPGFEGIYMASTSGKIRVNDRSWVTGKNLKRFKKGHELVLVTKHNGYKCVQLCKNSVSKQYSVHQLIGRTFIDNPENKPFINHKNGIKTDNSVDNLEWCTQLENNVHALRTKLRVNPSGEKNGYSVSVFVYMNDRLIGKFPTLKECSKVTGLPYDTVYKISAGKQTKAGVKILRA